MEIIKFQISKYKIVMNASAYNNTAEKFFSSKRNTLIDSLSPRPNNIQSVFSINQDIKYLSKSPS